MKPENVRNLFKGVQPCMRECRAEKEKVKNCSSRSLWPIVREFNQNMYEEKEILRNWCTWILRTLFQAYVSYTRNQRGSPAKQFCSLFQIPKFVCRLLTHRCMDVILFSRKCDTFAWGTVYSRRPNLPLHIDCKPSKNLTPEKMNCNCYSDRQIENFHTYSSIRVRVLYM